MQSLVNVERLTREALRNNERNRGYNPVIPGFGTLHDLSATEYLEAYGVVQDNKTKRRVPFRVDAVNENLTTSILDYVEDPGFDEDGLPYWLVVVSGRQSTKSTVSAYGLYSMVAREPGAEAFIVADTNPRAKYLYDRARQLHRHIPSPLQAPLINRGTERSLKFDPDIGGSLDFFSAERKGGMIGYSGRIGQVSEIPFMADPAKTLSVLLPALYHQSDSRLILESTPAPPNYAGAPYWQNLVTGAMHSNNRFKVVFSPFWESKLNRKTWKDEWTLTQEELKLLEQYGKLGLSLQNLAFRRSVMETDEDIRRNPDLFDVWYPFSLLTCWGGGNVGLFPPKVLLKHSMAMEAGRYNPTPFETHRRVVLGADPAGLLGGADHAAFAVIAADQNDWDLREVFSGNVTTHEFVTELLETAERYHKLTGQWPDIAVESNGAGAATLALLIERRYPRLYFEAPRKPGITATKASNNRMIAETCDALLDDFSPIFSLPLMMQLQSYTGDRQKRTSELSMLINGLAKGRRERQHWDLASAFMLAVDATRNLPLPRAPYVERPIILEPRGFTAQDYEDLRRLQAEDAKRRQQRRKRSGQ